MLEYKYYIIYRTTCKINGKIYIGQHRTNDLDDSYLGSGKIITEDINKFGKENFEKEILFIFDNFEDMNAKEMELVTPEFVARDDTYNLIIGGQIDDHEARRLGGLKAVEKEKELGICTDPYKILSKDEIHAMNKKQADSLRTGYKSGRLKPTFQGKHHTEETLQKMHETHLRNKHQQGEKNSQYGKHWYMNPVTKECAFFYEGEQPESWIRGRCGDFTRKNISQ